jgi:hypothetical protein
VVSERLFIVAATSNSREDIMRLKQSLVLSFSVALMAACAPSQTEALNNNPTPETTPAEATTPEPETTASEPVSATAKTGVIKSGEFVSGEHDTSGMARLVNDGGQFVLELDESFQTSPMGPDLVVVLHKSEDVIGGTEPPAFPLQEGEYLFLAELESFSGAQRYAIPADVNLDNYRSAAIWCRRFNATFGAATLQ